MGDNKIRVAITHGNTNGIGYEVILKAFEDPQMLELCTPIIYGSPKAAAYHRKAMELQTNFTIINSAEEARDGKVNILTTFEEEVKIEFGHAAAEAEEAAQKASQRAKEDAGKNVYDVLVKAPVEHPEAKDGNALEILINDNIRLAIVAPQVPIKEVAQSITKENIVRRATTFFKSLRRDFRISNPRIAILALNPTSATNEPGAEEKEAILPAIEELEKNGNQAFGPYPADIFFGEALYNQFDGVLAMYHDQGLTPFKTLTQDYSVKYTAGLPLVVTTPDHGVEFDRAGKGTADESSMRHAIYAAIDIFRNRMNYDEPLANPLQKLYHEKRDDSEKVRFSIPKPKDQFKKEDKTTTPSPNKA